VQDGVACGFMRRTLADPLLRRLLLTGLLGFFVIGALQAAYGPALPGLSRRFDVGLDQLGQALALHFAGSFVTIATSAPILTRFGYRASLLAGSSVMLAGAFTVLFAPTWPWFFAGTLLGGLGFGLVDVSLNLVVARSFAPNAAPALNLLNAFFGVGSVAAPAAVALSGGTIAPAMVIVLVSGSMMMALTWGLVEPERPVASRAAIPWFAAAGFLLMYFVYVAGEAGVGSWLTVHLAPWIGESAAAWNASAYWASLTVGRLIATPISARVAPATLVVASSLVVFMALAATHVPTLAPFAYPLAGLAFAPIFPTGLAWLQRVFPTRSEAIASAVLAAATLGPVATSGLIGWLVERGGAEVIATVMTLVGGALFTVSFTLARVTRRA